MKEERRLTSSERGFGGFSVGAGEPYANCVKRKSFLGKTSGRRQKREPEKRGRTGEGMSDKMGLRTWPALYKACSLRASRSSFRLTSVHIVHDVASMHCETYRKSAPPPHIARVTDVLMSIWWYQYLSLRCFSIRRKSSRSLRRA